MEFIRPIVNNSTTDQTKQIKLINNLLIGYRLIGYGDVIVLCQGAYLNMLCWDSDLLEEISKNYSVLIWDYPGIGESSSIEDSTTEKLADILKQLLDHLNIKPKAIIGYSMGGFVAQVFAIKYQYNLEKLVLMSTHAGGATKNKSELQTGAALLEGSLSEKLPAMLPFLFSEKEVERQLYRKIEQIFNNADCFGCLSSEIINKEQLLALEWMADNLFKSRLAEISIPTLIIVGEQDRLSSFEKSKELRQLITNSTLISYPNAAHGVMFQYPCEIAKAIKDFMKTKISRD